MVRRIINALLRTDQIATDENAGYTTDWLAPVVADAEAGFGGPLNAFELTKAMIAAGAAGIHYEDQLASDGNRSVPGPIRGWARGCHHTTTLPRYRRE